MSFWNKYRPGAKAETMKTEYLQETRELYKQYYKRELPEQQCIEIFNNVFNLFMILSRIAKSEKQR